MRGNKHKVEIHHNQWNKQSAKPTGYVTGLEYKYVWHLSRKFDKTEHHEENGKNLVFQTFTGTSFT